MLQRAVQWLLTRAPMTPVHDNRGGWYPWRIHEPYTGAWQRNVEWTTDSVLAHHAVYACVTRIAQDVGKLAPRLVELDENGIWTETTNAAHSPVLARPNRFQNHIQFKEWWTTSKLLHGNAYALLRENRAGVVDAMYVLDPSRVRVLVAPDGEVFYDLKVDHLSELGTDRVAVPASEIVHDRINCLFHPLVGVSPIFACGLAAHMGIRIQENSSDFFGNGSSPSGILSSPMPITPTKSKELSEIWNTQYAGHNSGAVAVLGDGMSYTQLRMSATDSQMLEQLKWSAETVCSTFHVPPWMVGVGEQPAYTKPEIANQAYYSYCLQALIEQWELCMDEALGLTKSIDGRRLGVELDLDGLLRMDAASQVSTMVEGIRGGLFTPNGARKRVGEGPVKGGDTIWLQQQDVPIEVAFENALNPPAPPAPPPPVPPTPEPEEPEEDDGERAALAALVDSFTFELELAAA